MESSASSCTKGLLPDAPTELPDSADDGSESSIPTNASPYPHWHTVVAGGTAGFASRMATAPLDLIRIRRQLTVTYPSESLWTSWRKIVQNEGGIPALYRGNMAAIYLWIGYAAVQFSVFNATKDAIRSNSLLPVYLVPSDHSSVAVSFCAGAIAGICATLVTYPFDVCRTTFSARGLIPNASNDVSATSSTLVSKQPSTTPQPHLHLSSLYEPPLFPSAASTHSSTPNTFLSSATTVAPVKPIHPTYPIPASSLTMQPSSTPLPRTFLEFVKQMYQLQGFRGFYAGASPAILQIIPYMGLNFAIYDYLVSLSSSTNTSSDKGGKKSKTSVGFSAYAGSLSGAFSKMLVYPLDTVKRRLQAQAFFASSTPHDRARRHYQGTWDCIITIYKTEGWMSFYRGIVPSVAKTAIASSLTFACFHWTQNTLAWIHDLRH